MPCMSGPDLRWYRYHVDRHGPNKLRAASSIISRIGNWWWLALGSEFHEILLENWVGSIFLKITWFGTAPCFFAKGF